MEEINTCTICYNLYSDDDEKVTLLPCKHYFGKTCINNWLNRSSNCPKCMRVAVKYKDKSGNIKDLMRNRIQNWICLHWMFIMMAIIIGIAGSISVYIRAYDEHPLITIIDGKLLIYGDNRYGQLGQGDTLPYLFPRYVPGLENITSASSSGQHTGVIMNKKLYMFGDNRYGQLGLDDNRDRYTPTLVPNLDDVTEVICINSYTAVINNGTLYMFGYNYDGQLGVGDNISRYTPTAIPELENVKKILCTDYYTVILKDDQIYTFGLIDGIYKIQRPIKILYHGAYDISENRAIIGWIFIHSINKTNPIHIYDQIRLEEWKEDYHYIHPKKWESQYIKIERNHLQQMENLIKSYCENKFTYIPFIPLPEESIERVYKLLIKHKFHEPETDIEMLYSGNYYEEQRDHDNAKKYFLMAIEKGNRDAMYYLGWHYLYFEMDYKNMEKYWLMAYEKGNIESIYELGRYYHYVTKDYDNMMKYYLQAIKKNNTIAMIDLGTYYKEQNDDDNMKKYYLMAIEAGDNNIMYTLVKYYREHDDYNSLIELYIKTKQYKELQETLEYMYKNNKTYNEQIIQHIIEHIHHLMTNGNELLIKILFQLIKTKN